MHDHQVGTIQRELQLTVEGESLPIQLHLSVLKDEKNNEIGKVLVFDDLSMIVNAQRAEAWREVARRIAHEIKNPLTPIKLSAERLQRKFGAQIQDQAFSECTTMIIKQTDELKNLVNEFNQFARLPKSKMALGNLNKTVEEALVLYRSAHSQCNIIFAAEERLPEIKFDSEQMKRVISNLVDNALAAIPPDRKGRIEVSIKFDSDLKIVTISVVDNGVGITAEHRNRVFEPYFSTKEGGTGLGLPIVKRIIEDHNGFIRALAAEPHGTKMLIELPVVESSTWGHNL
jgi:two-component system nitrogen regulation sensor histidine kinase NtrY